VLGHAWTACLLCRRRRNLKSPGKCEVLSTLIVQTRRRQQFRLDRTGSLPSEHCRTSPDAVDETLRFSGKTRFRRRRQHWRGEMHIMVPVRLRPDPCRRNLRLKAPEPGTTDVPALSTSLQRLIEFEMSPQGAREDAQRLGIASSRRCRTRRESNCGSCSSCAARKREGERLKKGVIAVIAFLLKLAVRERKSRA